MTIQSSAQVAVDALGHENGSVLAMDPSTGRILTIVNQKMAFSSGFEPCSTIKPVIALAGLQEGVITRDTMIKIGHRRYMDLTEAMAHSNNEFFQEVGTRLGFDARASVRALARFGRTRRLRHSGRAAGFSAGIPPAFGGVARMSSFGEAFGSRRSSSLRWFPLWRMAARSITCSIRAPKRLARILNRACANNWISRRSCRTCAKACSRP